MKNIVKSYIIIILTMMIAFTVTACSLDLDFGSQKSSGLTVSETNGRLIINGLDGFKGYNVVAVGAAYIPEGYNYLWAADRISDKGVLTGIKITGDQAAFKLWQSDGYNGTRLDKNDLVDCDLDSRFFMFIYVFNKNKTTYTTSDDRAISRYLYQGKPKPNWLKIVGFAEKKDLIEGKGEVEFMECLPVSP